MKFEQSNAYLSAKLVKIGEAISPKVICGRYLFLNTLIELINYDVLFDSKLFIED